MTPPKNDLLHAVKEMTGQVQATRYAVDANRDELARLGTFGRTSRRYIKLLVVSVCFDVLLSIGLGLVGVRAYTAALEAKTATAASRVAANNLRVICRAGNESRAIELKLWNSVLLLPPVVPETPAQKKQRADFAVFVAESYAPRKCE